jgi:hypothetical protein
MSHLPNVSPFGLSLNPGPFTIMASVGGSSAFAVSAKFRKLSRELLTPSSNRHHRRCSEGSSIFWMYVYLQTPLNFHLSFPETDRWLLVMSTQVIGFSIGGICKRVLFATAVDDLA